MVDLSVIHSITIAWHEGLLTLALIAVVVRLLVNVVPKLPVVGWFFSNEFLQKTARTSEIVALIAGLGGTFGIVASAVSGTLLTPSGILQSPIVQNKVMVSIFAFMFWMDFLVIRLKFGDEKIWNNRVLQFFYPLTALVGYAFLTVSGSLGGTLAGKESVLDFIFAYLGIRKTDPWILPPIAEFSKIVANSPLKDMVNVPSILQTTIILNIVIIGLILTYVAAGTHSKSKA